MHVVESILRVSTEIERRFMWTVWFMNIFYTYGITISLRATINIEESLDMLDSNVDENC